MWVLQVGGFAFCPAPQKHPKTVDRFTLDLGTFGKNTRPVLRYSPWDVDRSQGYSVTGGSTTPRFVVEFSCMAVFYLFVHLG